MNAKSKAKQENTRNEAIAAVIKKHAKARAGRCGNYGSLYHDLTSEGWVKALQLLPKFVDDGKPYPMERFLSIPLKRHMVCKSIQFRVPVFYGSGHEERHIKAAGHAYTKLRDTAHAALAEESLDAKLVRSRVRDAVHKTGGDIAVRYMLMGATASEISKDIGKGPRTVESHMRRTKKALRKQLNPGMLQDLTEPQ